MASLDMIRRGKTIARAQWQVVAIVCLGGGLTLLVPCSLLMVFTMFGLLPDSFGSAFIYATPLLPGVLWIMMAVKPQSPYHIVFVA